MKRIILHWTAGTHKVSAVDREHYHFIVSGLGNVEKGDHRPEDNLSTSDGIYAAHTRGANSGAIGVSMAAMLDAKDSLNLGKFPITAKQFDAMIALVKTLCKQYKIPVTPTTVLSHAEVEKTLGIKQNGKIDISFGIPGKPKLTTALACGNYIRGLLSN